MKRLVLVIVMVCGAAFFGAVPASAHSELVSSNPSADTTLELAPTDVELEFDQEINELFATVSLVGPDGEQWSEGATTVDGPRATVGLKDGLPNGDYTVGYRVTSADGHPISGSFGFSIDAAASTSSTAQSLSPRSLSPQSVSPQSVSPTYDPNNPSASEADRPPKQNTMVLLSIVAIAVLGLAGIAVALVVRSKNRQ